ncbi:hypothetical protein G6N05_05275 [Flavobacterium sp. F372]|uniref:Uncharacterized protein n=1 Tax=Flavobacterium bernardetii TaxID=2813823 RepID=A0ABR7J144_9FLAO|nr:hypothetical protein [Flavobacterium bernardetii]MBC5835791.1 hypothetical protein [Flavobacterium bernardetii]NHF69522.1 hypothetical protein [Flavobacterium bernardetii]
MNKFKSKWNSEYDKKNPKQYSDKGYRAFIIGLIMGLILGAAVTIFLVITYTLIFK